jgi:predicted component of type VI protein secretion system
MKGTRGNFYLSTKLTDRNTLIRVEMLFHSGTLSRFRGKQSFPSPLKHAWLAAKHQNINLIVFDLTRPHESCRNKSKDWMARNQDNVSERSDMSTRGLSASTITIPTKRFGLV